MIQIINKYSRTPFEYGVTDCCQFAGECIEYITGSNPGEAFKRSHPYANKTEAYERIAEYGSLENLLTARLGGGIQGTYEPKDGDLALFKSTDGLEMVGVIYRDVALVLTEGSGVMDWPISRAYKVWVT